MKPKSRLCEREVKKNCVLKHEQLIRLVPTTWTLTDKIRNNIVFLSNLQNASVEKGIIKKERKEVIKENIFQWKWKKERERKDDDYKKKQCGSGGSIISLNPYTRQWFFFNIILWDN